VPNHPLPQTTGVSLNNGAVSKPVGQSQSQPPPNRPVFPPMTPVPAPAPANSISNSNPPNIQIRQDIIDSGKPILTKPPPEPSVKDNGVQGDGNLSLPASNTRKTGISSTTTITPISQEIPIIPAMPEEIFDKPIEQPSSVKEECPSVESMNALQVDNVNMLDQTELSMFNDSPKDQAGGNQHIKNASSWSSLAQGAGGVGGNTPGSRKSTVAMNSFQQFKKQAKEKADKQRALIEQQEIRRRQSEQVEKERQRLEQEKRQQREEEDALERARKSMMTEPVAPGAQIKNSEHLSASPAPASSPVDNEKLERERQRQREQDRRRREAMAGQIDMNLQSELLAAFEENVL